MTDHAYLTLALVPGIGRARLDALLHTFESPAAALDASFSSLLAVPGISRAAATAIREADRALGARVLARVTEMGASVLVPKDPHFPRALREIPDGGRGVSPDGWSHDRVDTPLGYGT